LSILRSLAHTHPKSVIPPLAQCLFELARISRCVNDLTNASRYAGESISLYRNLACATPDVPCYGLAQSMTELGYCLFELKWFADACSAFDEGLGVGVSSPRSDSTRHVRALALQAQTYTLAHLNRHSEAAIAARTATEILRELASDSPRTYNIDLANSLKTR